jgi:hypothetical protein
MSATEESYVRPGERRYSLGNAESRLDFLQGNDCSKHGDDTCALLRASSLLDLRELLITQSLDFEPKI